MSGKRFEFAGGNIEKLLAVPKYLVAMVIAWFVPRVADRWVFGSGIGVAEGSLAVARALKQDDPQAHISWLVTNEHEAERAAAEGFEAVKRTSAAGFWATLRAGQIVVTHGLGDVNRFGVFGGRVINLIHGAPLKKLHLDSPVTTQFRGPAPLRALLRRMYVAGTKQVSMYVAGSITAAERLRSAYRVDPGKVQVLGDPRDDALCEQAADPQAAALARDEVRRLLALEDSADREHTTREKLVLYAPTWRDGKADPAEPTPTEAQLIAATLERIGARLVIRPHPLGNGAYEALRGPQVQMLGSDVVRDITPLLGTLDAVISDISSLANDFSLLGRPIVWFVPNLAEYSLSRGLYEPLEVTSGGRVQHDWHAAIDWLERVLTPGTIESRAAAHDATALAARFHAYAAGGAARRVIAAVRRLALKDEERIALGSVFFESFYGRQVSCNPLALDREIARQLPDIPRYWSVISERTEVPDGATALLVGSPDWYAARRRARLLIVNDWLRYGFRRAPHQTVLQTWHGTMLKHLALGRPRVSLRTRLAIHRESRRWNLLLSQNPHSTEQFRASYAYRGEVLEVGYPRDDRLANAVAGGTRIALTVDAARRTLGVPTDAKVLAYVPTWRDGGGTVDLLDVHALAADLGDEWVVIARGHTRSAGSYLADQVRVRDASAHPDVNDVLLAADVLVTDYSSVMFDASVARVPMLFYVPDLAAYRDRERGFTFDFEATAPGPLLTQRAQVVQAAQARVALGDNYDAWQARFNPHDDGLAAARVVAALRGRGALGDTVE